MGIRRKWTNRSVDAREILFKASSSGYLSSMTMSVSSNEPARRAKERKILSSFRDASRSVRQIRAFTSKWKTFAFFFKLFGALTLFQHFSSLTYGKSAPILVNNESLQFQGHIHLGHVHAKRSCSYVLKKLCLSFSLLNSVCTCGHGCKSRHYKSLD